MRRLALFVSFVLGLGMLSTSGCAFGNRHVKLTYPPPAQGTQVGAANAARSEPPGIGIVVRSFTDGRDRPPIGEVRNGFGMHTADVLAEGDVGDWVTDAVVYELRAAGFRARAYQDGPAPAPDELVVSGEVLTFYCRAMMSYEADVSLLVQFAAGNQVVFHGRFSGTGSAGVNWAASADGYGESLAGALQQAARGLVARVRPVMARPRPPAPAPAAPTGTPPATSGPPPVAS